MDNEFYDYQTTTGGIAGVLTGKESIKVEHSVAVPWKLFAAFAILSIVLMMARKAFSVGGIS